MALAIHVSLTAELFSHAQDTTGPGPQAQTRPGAHPAQRVWTLFSLLKQYLFLYQWHVDAYLIIGCVDCSLFRHVSWSACGNIDELRSLALGSDSPPPPAPLSKCSTALSFVRILFCLDYQTSSTLIIIIMQCHLIQVINES